MKLDALCQTARRACPWVYLVICLIVILGGCQKKEIPLSKAAQTCKMDMLGEMNMLTAALTKPVAQQDWQAAEPILKTSFEKLTKEGKLIPLRMGVLDRNGIAQAMVPPRKGVPLDFRSYAPARVVFEQKKIAQGRLYIEGKKMFVLAAPLLQQDRVTGVVVIGFPEEELQKCHLSDQEFMDIDFNK
jgi:hypothetical protein